MSFRRVPPWFVPFTIHGEKFEEAGATAVEEVGFTLAAGVDFLAAMQDARRSGRPCRGFGCVLFRDRPKYFFQIAKLRAFRMVWAQAVESFGGSA